MRWWTVARLLRFGINVAQWDVDLTIHGDMYEYFKSDPMEGIHWVCSCEGVCGGLECNGGVPFSEEQHQVRVRVRVRGACSGFI